MIRVNAKIEARNFIIKLGLSSFLEDDLKNLIQQCCDQTELFVRADDSHELEESYREIGALKARIDDLQTPGEVGKNPEYLERAHSTGTLES
jgi:hypothetical protein